MSLYLAYLGSCPTASKVFLRRGCYSHYSAHQVYQFANNAGFNIVDNAEYIYHKERTTKLHPTDG